MPSMLPRAHEPYECAGRADSVAKARYWYHLLSSSRFMVKYDNTGASTRESLRFRRLPEDMDNMAIDNNKMAGEARGDGNSADYWP